MSLCAFLTSSASACSRYPARAPPAARLDLVGVEVIVMVTAIGGGTLGDLLMDRAVFWLTDPAYLTAIFVAVPLTLLHVRYCHPPLHPLKIVDAIGLALFSISGARIAETVQLPGLIVVVLATITATLGGVLHDVLCNEIPMNLRSGKMYASTVVFGVSLYVIAQRLGLSRDLARFIGMSGIPGLRLSAIWWDLRLPVVDLDQPREPR